MEFQNTALFWDIQKSNFAIIRFMNIYNSIFVYLDYIVNSVYGYPLFGYHKIILDIPNYFWTSGNVSMDNQKSILDIHKSSYG